MGFGPNHSGAGAPGCGRGGVMLGVMLIEKRL